MSEVCRILHLVFPSYSESRWATQRKAFGKPLISQAVIRSKLAAMIARTESVQSWLENITYQMCHMVRTSSPLSFSCRILTRYLDIQTTIPEARWVGGGYVLCVTATDDLFLLSQIAFLKSYSTRCAQETAKDAVQIFGGRGITRTGMGRFIEHVSQTFQRLSLSYWCLCSIIAL